MPVIRVLIVSDIRLYREGLADVLSRRGVVQVAGAAGSEDEALAAIDACHADIVLVDMTMLQAQATARALLANQPDLRVVALAVPEMEPDVLMCAELGVSGLVARDASLDDLIATLQSAARGEARCTPRMAASILRRLASLAEERGTARPDMVLTVREREVVELVDRGLSNKEIARRLGVEVATVKNHVHNILEKLQVHRRGEAAARVRAGLRWRTRPVAAAEPAS